MTAAFDFSLFDRSTRPQDDLFRHANGAWLDTVRIDADRGDLAGVQLTAEAYDTFLF